MCSTKYCTESDMPIPTICFDSLNESGATDQIASSVDTEWHWNDDHAFIGNIPQFFSWLSYFGSYRKFLVAVTLLSHCEPHFRRAACKLFSQDSCRNTEDEQQDYWASLQWGTLEPNELIVRLSGLIMYLISSTPSVPYSKFLHRLSVSTAAEKPKDSATETPQPKMDPAETLISGLTDEQTTKIQSLKKHFLFLFGELLCHYEEFVDVLTPKYNTETLSTSSDSLLREVILQSDIGQLLVKTLLFPPFTLQDRNGLLEILRSHRESLTASPLSVKSLDAPYSDVHLRIRFLDILLELAFDLSSIVHSALFGLETSASLSHSLTSSGFLSGSGGLGSQYDLLSEVSNTNGGSQYGTLLTVPTSDPRCLATHALPGQWQFSYNQWESGSDVRRQSDCPFIVGSSSASFPFHNQGHLIKQHSSNSVRVMPLTNPSADLTAESRSQHGFYFAPKPSFASRSSLPNALTPNHIVGTICEQPIDSASPSSDSSTFSSNLDLGTSCPQRPDSTILVSTLDPTTSSYQKNLRLLSPSSDVPLPKSVDHFPSSASDQSSLLESNAVSSIPERPVVCSACFAHIRSNEYPAVSDSTVEKSISQSHMTIASEQLNEAYDDHGVIALPMWLKSLRLHKYAGLFEHMNYNEFLNVSESWLESRNVTQGARTKLLLSIQKLFNRPTELSQVENSLLQAPAAGPGALSALQNCLSVVWNILHSPIQPCSSERSTTPSCFPERHSYEKHSVDCVTPLDANLSKLTTADCRETSTYLVKHLKIQSTEVPEARLIPDEHECLPSRSMSCLAKVCSRLLVSSRPDLDCCKRFLDILEIISKHPGFTEKHKNLASVWMQQMYSLQERDSSCLLTMGATRSSYSIPRAFRGAKPWRKILSAHCQQQTANSCAKSFGNAFVTPHASNEEPVRMSPEEFRDQFNLIRPLTKHKGKVPGDRGCAINQSFDDSGLRRHSVPMNPSQPVSSPLRPFQGRRMPSPNPRYTPNRDNSAASNMCVHFPDSAHVFTVDLEDAHSTAQISRARLPKPCVFDNCFAVSPPNSLIPPATAPPTRMPSPSDVNRTGHFSYPLKSGSYVTGANISIDRPVCACTTGTAIYPTEEYTHLSRSPSSSQSTTVFDRYVEHFQQITPGVNCLPPTLLTARPSATSSSAADLRGFGQEVPSGAWRDQNRPFFPCVAPFVQCAARPVHVLNLSSVNPEQCSRSSVSNNPKQPQPNVDYIEHDLELLTRNVTELAIGDFDSPVE